MINQKTSNFEINILIVLDAEQICNNLSATYCDASRPITINPTNSYIVAPDCGCIALPSLVTIHASPSSIMKIRATTTTQNATQSVIIYQVESRKSFHPNEIFTPAPITINNSVQPDSTTSDGLPAIHQVENFTSLDTQIKSNGKKTYRVFFSLYTLDDDSENQILQGYFCFDLKINIK